jgi:hypothetical protein
VIFHIAPDLAYLFPDTADTARVRCGKLAREAIANGEAVAPFAENTDEERHTICEACLAAFEASGDEERMK